MRIGISMYGAPDQVRSSVSGLIAFQQRYRTMLAEVGVEVVEFFLAHGRAPARGEESTYRKSPGGHHLFVFDPKDRRFCLPDEAAEVGLSYPQGSLRLVEDLLEFYQRERLDAVHLVEWMPLGMALWEAALRWDRPTVFTPTEHGAVCHLGFLLNNCGTACSGPADGGKCGRCTHSLEPYPVTPAVNADWFSKRHRVFHRAAKVLPPVIRPHALWSMSEHFANPGTVLSEAEGRARVLSARRFLRDVAAVAYQSPRQHRVFERALGLPLPARLPLVIPVPQLYEFSGKAVHAGSRPVTFAFAARPNFDRGLWFLLEAWRAWSPRPDAARLLIHTHDDGSGLAGKVAELRAGGCAVELQYGRLSSEAMVALHRRTHFIVNPAVWEETLSATVLEGFMLGTPAIVPTLSGSADFVETGRNGYRYEFRELSSLASCMDRAVTEMPDWERLHQGALESAHEYQRASAAHVSAFLEILSGGTGCTRPVAPAVHRSGSLTLAASEQ